jgi:hypothetical protein
MVEKDYLTLINYFLLLLGFIFLYATIVMFLGKLLVFFFMFNYFFLTMGWSVHCFFIYYCDILFLFTIV